MCLIIVVVKHDDRGSSTALTRAKSWARRCLSIKNRKFNSSKDNEITRDICRQILSDSPPAYEDERNQQLLAELGDDTDRQICERTLQGTETTEGGMERV